MNRHELNEAAKPLGERKGAVDSLVIKSCPFCGATDDFGIGRGTEDSEGFPTYLYCASCGAQGPWIYTRDNLVFTCTAIAADKTGWNQRAL